VAQVASKPDRVTSGKNEGYGDTRVEATALLLLSGGRGPRSQIRRDLFLQVVGAESGRAEGAR
jgi:hypothetical protein